MTKRQSLAIALTVVTAVAVGGPARGCDAVAPLSKADYERTVITVYDEVRRAFAATRVDSEALLGERVAAAQAALREAADRLSAVQPPPDAEAPNRELVAAWRAYAQALGELRAAIRRGDRGFRHRFNEGVATHPAVLRAKEAAEELKERGFRLGILARD